MENQIDQELFVMDKYSVEAHLFNVMGNDIEISGSSLANSLNRLSEQELNILFLYYVFDMNDREICEQLRMSRQFVQNKRINARDQLKTMLEEYDDE